MKNEQYELILEGLTTEETYYVKSLIKQIDSNVDGTTKQLLNAIIRFVVKKIFEKESHYLISDNRDLLIRMVDVKKLTNQLTCFLENYIPIAQGYFPNLDYQAESILLFANNYVSGLLNKIKNDKNNLIPRKFKLEKLNNI